MSTDYANTDGSHTAVLSTGTVNYQTASGAWAPVDNSIVADTALSGGFTNAGNSWHVHFGTSAQGVDVTTATGGLALVPVGAATVSPVVDAAADEVSYPNLWPGVTLQYRVTGDGVEESLLLSSANAGSSFAFRVSDGSASTVMSQMSSPSAQLAPTGAALVQQSNGGLAPASGPASGLQITPPLVVDHDGNGLGEAGASMSASGNQLTLSLSASWLAAQPASAFPIDLDPSITPGAGAVGAYKSDGTTGSGVQWGNPNEAGTTVYWRTVAHFGYESLFGDHVTGSEIETAWQGGTANQYPVSVYWASSYTYGGAKNGSVLATGSPGSHNLALTGSALTNQISSWVNSRGSGGSFGFVGDEVPNAYTYQQYNLALYISYTRPPSAPSSVGWSSPSVACATGASTPTIDGTKASEWHATLSSPDGLNVQGKYKWWDAATPSSTHLATSAVVASGHQSTVSFNANVFADGHTYYWQVYATDGFLNGPSSGSCEFKVVDPPPNLPANPGFSSPVAACTTSAPVPAMTGTAPIGLSAKISDPDGKTVTAKFQVVATGTTSPVLWSYTPTPNVASGSTITVTIPANTLANGTAFTWQVQASNGQKTSLWTAGCEGSIDDTVPAAPVPASTDFGTQTAPAGQVGVPGTVMLPSQADVVEYVWSLSSFPTGDKPACGTTDPVTGARAVCASAGGAWNSVSVEPEVGDFQVYAVAYTPAGTGSPQGSAHFYVNETSLGSPSHSWLTDTANTSDPTNLPTTVPDYVTGGPALNITPNSGSTSSWVADGVFGNGPAMHFDGAAGHADMPAPAAGGAPIDLTHSLSVVTYVRPEFSPMVNTDQMAVSVDGASASALSVQTDLSGNLEFCLEITDSGTGSPNWDCADSTVAPTAGSWESVVAVWDQPAHQLRLYVGGTLVASQSHASSAAVNGALAVGRGLLGSAKTEFWNGDVSDPTVYPGVLDPAQVGYVDQHGLPFDPTAS